MSEGHVLIEIEDGVGTLTLNRPDKLNAFIGEMRGEIAGGIETLGADDGVRAVIITGTGRAFCAGADVKYLTHLIETRAIDEAVALVEAGRRVASAIRGMPKPVIAAVNGPAAGGGANLALACDLRLASETASIGQTFNRIGLHPDWGGTYAVPRLVGPARTAELFFFAEMVPAAECERIGLVNRVVPADELMPLAREWARTLARTPASSATGRHRTPGAVAAATSLSTAGTATSYRPVAIRADADNLGARGSADASPAWRNTRP